MKPFYLLVSIFILGPMAASAQSIEFAPAGSVWEYRRQLGIFGPPVYDFAEVRYVDDVLVDTILCKRLSSAEGDYYVYQTGDRVYHRRDTAAQFKLLWDFGVMPGDSFFVSCCTEFVGLADIRVVCTGRDTIIENGLQLPRIDLVFYCGLLSPTLVTVNPRYGPMYAGGCPNYVFNNDYCVIDGYYGYTLLSYIDNSFSGAMNCSTSTNDMDGEQPTIQAHPNPTTGRVQLTNFPSGANIRCYDAFGRSVDLPADAGNSVDLSGYPSGLYVVEVYAGGRRFQWVKVVKL
jgi:Secretion system C-terminal sorting domain